VYLKITDNAATSRREEDYEYPINKTGKHDLGTKKEHYEFGTKASSIGEKD
jgi:hypothetical protein